MSKTQKPDKTAKQEALAKPPKPAKKKAKESLNREERKKAAWQRKTERRVAAQAVTEVAAKTSTGLTYGQLESSGLITKSKPAAGPTFDQTLLEILKEQTQLESAESVHLSMDVLEPEIRISINGEIFNNTNVEDMIEPFGTIALRRAATAEIRSLLEKTGHIFSAYRGPGILAAQLDAEELFEKEPEESSLRLRLAEVILTDDPGEAIEEFLEEVYDRIQELQIVASALDPESELEKSARLGLIDEATVARLKRAAAEEAVRLDLAQRLAGLTTSATTLAEVDRTFATLITEAAQAAEVQRRERAAFRRTLSQGLRQRKEREGRRFSKSSEESGDEEFIRFLLSHRGDLAAVRNSLPFHLREQVETLLKDEERKGPLLRQIAAANAAANQLWAELKTRLAAGADKPEATVAQNAAAMKSLLGIFAQIRALHIQLEELDRPR